MPRFLPLLLVLCVGVAAGVGGDRVLRPSTPAGVLASPPENAWQLNQDIVRLESDKLSLQAELRQLQAEHQENLQRADRTEAEVEQLAEANQQLQSQLNETGGKLTVAEAAKATLAEELANAQQEVGALQQNLAFFEQLIPESSKPAASVSIRSADVGWQGDALRFRILVMRTRPATDDFQGTLQFTATGMRDGSSATISLETLATAPRSEIRTGADTGAAPVALRFRQYQRVSGQLVVPTGFEPRSITVTVLEGKTVRSEHTIGLDPKESTQ